MWVFFLSKYAKWVTFSIIPHTPKKKKEKKKKESETGPDQRDCSNFCE